MHSKYMHYAEMANTHAKEVTASADNWADMLTTASRLYKYSFDEQLLIHAQRPSVTACAQYNTWNDRMGRYVKRGSKGIALLDNAEGKRRLKYVFDVTDTEMAHTYAKTPVIWQMTADNEPTVKSIMELHLRQNSPSLPVEDLAAYTTALNAQPMAEYIHTIANDIAYNYFAETRDDILQALEGSDIAENANAFISTLSDSAAFMLMSRCGINIDEYTHKDEMFSSISQFTTPAAVNMLGESATVIASSVLLDIEKTLKRDRSVEHGRTNLHSSRGLSDSQHRNLGRRGESTIPNQVGDDAQNISANASQDNLHQQEPERNIVPSLSGGRETGNRANGSADATTDQNQSTARQSQRPNGLDSAHDQPTRTGRGDSQSRNNLRSLNELSQDSQDEPPNTGGFFNAAAQLTIDMFPSEEEQKETILTSSHDETKLQSEQNTPTATNSIWDDYKEVSTNSPDAIVFLRVGDFYEVMGENATTVAEALGLAVVSRGIANGEDVPLVGIPMHSLDKALKQLEENGLNVVVVESINRSIKNENAPSLPAPEKAVANFRITDFALGEGGTKSKYSNNIIAIHTLQTIESENRNATPQEQELLSRYVGWGGIQQAFDPDAVGWEKEYNELKSLLTPEEYEAARASVLNAHYTSPTVISAMHDALSRLGVTGGNILEPSMGVGNFFGLLPENMQSAKLYGVELDTITGRIAQQLYPNANIKVTGFEHTTMPDNFFDVAIGNVPFGGFSVPDKKYDKHNFMIHDYFFAKSLDQVRPGGIVAFVTSKGTLDKANPKVRKYLAERAELLGAVRLPNNAFAKNAGTEVTADIIFLQKRESIQAVEPDWVHLGTTDTGIAINSYFADNPHMVLGTMTVDSGMRMYGNENTSTCIPIEGADLSEQLKAAFLNIHGTLEYFDHDIEESDKSHSTAIIADPNVKNFSYTIVDEQVYFRENSIMSLVEMPTATLARVKDMVVLRDQTKHLIDLQLQNAPDSAIQVKQAELENTYDSFTKKHGLLNSSANAKAFSADSSYYLLASLEHINEDGELLRKSDMFTKRTIKHQQVITSVDTAAQALAVSISQRARVDIPFIAELTGFPHEKIVSDLQNIIFQPNPTEEVYVPADEYLSGNVRDKLVQAREYAQTYPAFEVNVAALEKAQPKDLDASEISVRIGSTWVDKAYFQQFMHETFNASLHQQRAITLHFSAPTGEWSVSGKSIPSKSDVSASTTFGTSRMNAYAIFEQTLNLRDVRVYDIVYEGGKEKRVPNKEETILALQKQDAIKEAFQAWVFNDPQRRQDLVSTYNKLFNSTRSRVYDGSHIELVGASPEISLRPHQQGAIARILYGGNTLLAHEVGAGKTFEMIGAAMESKRLGLCNKSLMVVPNHIIEDFAGEFIRLYPSANILVASKKDFEPANRKKFCARIATGDYDAIIIGHSQFEKIPLSKERQEATLREQISDVMAGIVQVRRENGERFTIKQLEKTKKSLEVRLAKLTEDSRKDDVVTFEQLGVDRLFVDEAHHYKNLYLVTKMRNVAGLSTSEAQKSSDLFMKCRYMDELTGGKGVIFATGTAISNSMSELFTMQRYLQYDTLQNIGLGTFDAWASTFGETVTAIELAPQGTGYRAKTRFSKFQNLPELMKLFGEVADIKTADTLDLPRPIANYKTIVAQPTELQRAMIDELSKRATAIREKRVDPSQDNMLKITSDGRKIGLDQRMMNPDLPDDPQSKVNLCMENVFQIWEESTPNRSTQIVFCDFSTPNKDGRFNVYDDIRDKLVAKGIPKEEIAFIHDYNNETQKKNLFAKVRSGSVRVLFGSTAKCGAGTNVQDRLIEIHDLDAPWRPSDLAQRAGRIERQGNQNPEVGISRYVTESTFDAYLFQTLENKQKFISQVITSKSPVRSCNDMDDDTLSYAEIKALCAGNPLIVEKMNLDIDVAKLKMLKANHQSQQYRLEDNLLHRIPKSIEVTKVAIVNTKDDIARLTANTYKSGDGISPMAIKGSSLFERKDAGAALIDACRKIQGIGPEKVASYRGFDIVASYDTSRSTYACQLKGSTSILVEMGNDPVGNVMRIDNALEKLPERLAIAEQRLESLYLEEKSTKEELTKPFALESELVQKSARLVELDAALSLDAGAKDSSPPEVATPKVPTIEKPQKQTEVVPVKPFVFGGNAKKDEAPAHKPPQQAVKDRPLRKGDVR